MRKSALVIAALVSFNLASCGQRPRIDVLVTIEDGRVVFDLPHSGMNYIMTFRILGDDQDPIWSVTLGSGTGKKNPLRLTYGVIPPSETDLNAAPHQVFPPENRPPRDIRGKTIQVVVTYQYDNLAPMAGSIRKSVEVP